MGVLRSALKLLEGETDAAMREALRVQMMEFGRTPRRLFRYGHPRRRAAVTGARAPPPLCGCLRVAQSPAPAPRAANPSQPEVLITVRARFDWGAQNAGQRTHELGVSVREVWPGIQTCRYTTAATFWV